MNGKAGMEVPKKVSAMSAGCLAWNLSDWRRPRGANKNLHLQDRDVMRAADKMEMSVTW